jgi:hypothetical protein
VSIGVGVWGWGKRSVTEHVSVVSDGNFIKYTNVGGKIFHNCQNVDLRPKVLAAGAAGLTVANWNIAFKAAGKIFVFTDTKSKLKVSVQEVTSNLAERYYVSSFLQIFQAPIGVSRGLCGNFDGNPNNDIKGVWRRGYDRAATFGKEWNAQLNVNLLTGGTNSVMQCAQPQGARGTGALLLEVGEGEPSASMVRAAIAGAPAKGEDLVHWELALLSGGVSATEPAPAAGDVQADATARQKQDACTKAGQEAAMISCISLWRHETPALMSYNNCVSDCCLDKKQCPDWVRVDKAAEDEEKAVDKDDKELQKQADKEEKAEELAEKAEGKE